MPALDFLPFRVRVPFAQVVTTRALPLRLSRLR